jgi:hypothetical protein
MELFEASSSATTIRTPSGALSTLAVPPSISFTIGLETLQTDSLSLLNNYARINRQPRYQFDMDYCRQMRCQHDLSKLMSALSRLCLERLCACAI